MKFLLVNYTTPNPLSTEIPFLWLTLKSYFQRNSKDPTAWQWLDPIHISVAEYEDELVTQIIDQDPDVLGISCYMWNDKLTMYVAEQVKKLKPSIKIIAGGPALYYEQDISWFKKHWFIDALCEYTGYGEIFITDYLDGVPLDKIPFCVYPSSGLSFWKKSDASYNKREFKYPMPYSDNIEYLERFPKDNDIKILLDTSRGCPYSCTFCEWGGGTASKVVFKSLEEVMQELNVAFNILKPSYVDILNANFGITEDDVQVAKKLTECHTIKYINVYGPTKSKKNNLKEIYDILLTANMLDDVKISIQHMDPTILKNIKRTDMAFDEQIQLFKDLREKHNNLLRIETMMGLPGETLDTYYSMTDDMTKSKWFEPMMHEWMLLPSAPAAKPEYMQEMQIKTKMVRYNVDWFDRHIIPRSEYSTKVEQTGKRQLLLDHKWLEPYNVVVSTYSYTIEDWAQMELFKYYFTFLNGTGVITPLTNYLRSSGVDMSGFNRSLFNDFLLRIPLIQKVYNEFVDNLKSEDPSDIFYADIADNFPFISHMSTLKFLILIDPDGFFKSMCAWLESKYGKDDTFATICSHISDNIMSPMREQKSKRQQMEECISMCKYWGGTLFLDDFVPKY